MRYDYAAAIAAYRPENDQETADQALMLDCLRTYGPALLTRQVTAAHLTVSGWVMNESLTRVLLARHNLLGWGWPGGHADGENTAETWFALAQSPQKISAPRTPPCIQS